MAANVNIVVNAQDRASGTLRKIRNGFAEILQVALGIRLSQMFNMAGEALRAFARNSIGAAAELQRFEIGVETLIAREQMLTGVTTDVAEAFSIARGMTGEYVKDLQTIALLSPYQFGDVQKMFRQAMAFGFMADEAKTFTTATLNVAAGVGAGNQQMDRMAYNLAQIRLQGKVTKLDIRQLALAGFDLLSVLRFVGEEMEVDIKTHLDFNKAIDSGKISWAEFTTSYASYADTYFGGASERMARTLFGLQNTIKDVFAVTMPQILGPALDELTGFVSRLLDMLLDLRESGILEEWGAKIKASFDEKIKPVLEFLFEGKTDRDNPFVRMLNMFKHLKAEGFFGDTWAYIFNQMTGIDVGPLQDFLSLFIELIGYLKEGDEILSDRPLAAIAMMLGLHEDALINLRDDVIAWATQLIAALKIVFTDPLGEGAANIFAEILGVDPTLIMGIQRTIKNIIAWIVQRFLDIKEGAAPLVEVFKNTVLPVLGMIFLFALKIGSIVGDFLIGAFTVISEWFAENGDLIATWWQVVTTIFGAIAAVIGVLITGVLAFLGPFLEGVLSWVLNVGAAIMAFFTGDWERGLELLKTGLSDLLAGFIEGLTALGEFLAGIWDEYIWPTLEGWLASAISFGASLITSIATGFSEGLGKALITIGKAVQGIIDFVASKLDMGSPSRVFMEMGAQSMVGFIEGFQPNNLLSAGFNQGVVPAMAGAGVGGGTTIINHYHGVTLQNRLQAERDLRPIVKKITG